MTHLGADAIHRSTRKPPRAPAPTTSASPARSRSTSSPTTNGHHLGTTVSAGTGDVTVIAENLTE
jgi:hypothetical protein